MRKILFVSAILLMSLLSMFQLIELTIANPVGMYGLKPTYAIVSIESPLYSSELSFTIKTNSFWQTGSNYSDSHCFIILDSNAYEFKELSLVGQNTISNDLAYDSYVEFTLKGTTPIANFTSLASGTHNVEVKYGYYQYTFPNRNYKMEFIAWGSATSQIILTQGIAQTPTSSPSHASSPSTGLSPTLSPASSPTTTPTMTHAQVSSNYSLNPTALTSIACVIAIVAVASSSLVYFRRRNKLTNK